MADLADVVLGSKKEPDKDLGRISSILEVAAQAARDGDNRMALRLVQDGIHMLDRLDKEHAGLVEQKEALQALLRTLTRGMPVLSLDLTGFNQ